MTDANANLMPQRERLVEETITRMAARGVRSKVMRAPDDVRLGFCLRLADPEVTRAEAGRWLEEQYNAIDQNALYRFASTFGDVYQEVYREHALRVARLTVGEFSDLDLDGMLGDAERLSVMVGQEILASMAGDTTLNTKDLRNVFGVIQGMRSLQQRDQQLELNLGEAERRERKLEVDLKAAQQQFEKAELERQRLELQLQTARREIDAAIAAASGEDKPTEITPEALNRVREAIFGN